MGYDCDAGFGLQPLGHWIRELTGRPFDLHSAADHGRIAAGIHADLMLFDRDAVAQSENVRVHDIPGGSSRLIREARGVRGEWVNGVQVR